MPICYLDRPASSQQLTDMLEALEVFVKFAVDIRREVAAGGGVLHADCEDVLLSHGCQANDIWGADYIPAADEVRFEALINLSPGRGNHSMSIQDEKVRNKVEAVLRNLIGETHT